jgi:phage/conjugal plasmid C-4 type zinc finger TraR family protein
MAGGWSRDGAVQDQIDASLKDALELARSRIPVSDGLAHCEECDVAIPIARREAIQGVRLCVDCQSGRDENQMVSEGCNRRGSKASQMK